MDSFFYDGSWLQQHTNMLKTFRYFDDDLDIVDVVFSQIAVAQVDAPLVIGVVGRHIVRADQVIDARTRTAHRGHDIVARLQFCDIGSDGFHLAEAFMADDQNRIREVLRRIQRR